MFVQVEFETLKRKDYLQKMSKTQLFRAQLMPLQ